MPQAATQDVGACANARYAGIGTRAYVVVVTFGCFGDRRIETPFQRIAKIIRANVGIIAIHREVRTRAVRETFVIGAQIFVATIGIVITSRCAFSEPVPVLQVSLNRLFTHRDRMSVIRISRRDVANDHLAGARCGGRCKHAYGNKHP